MNFKLNSKARKGIATFFRQLRFELEKMFGRKRTHVGFLMFVLLEFVFALIYKRSSVEEQVRESFKRKIERSEGGGEVLKKLPDFIRKPLEALRDARIAETIEQFYSALTFSHIIMGVSIVLMGGLFLALVAGDILSKEDEDGTLRMVLSRSVTRGRLLVIKYCACAIFTFTLIAFAALSSLAVGFIFWNAGGDLFVHSRDLGLTAQHEFGDGMWRYLCAIPFLALSMFVVSSVAFMFSCMRMKPATATIMTLSLLFIDTILKRMEELKDVRHMFITSRMSAWQHIFAKDGINWGAMWGAYFYLAAVCVATFCIGWWAFSRRDFKS